ncbi:MAG TPA: VWA domain-containing protein [Steroidobacteraceae bacterium]|nr:VWA domain-containing protein [Steroidobacteraceae bacterium]
MLIKFFFALRQGGVPVSTTELLTLLEALRLDVAETSVEGFYYLARTCMVKDEKHFDKFDRVFASYFKGVEKMFDALLANVPDEWLRREMTNLLSDEEKAKIEALGGWDKLMETLRKRFEEQKERHQGGNKWIGTGGTSPFGAHGFNPEGIRIGQGESMNRKAVKVWDQRTFRNLDDNIELGTRNIKLALRKLRKFAREGVADQLDMDDTINSTARNAGWLDLKFVPERHNAIKVLLLFDIGGTMDPYIKVCEELFSAARAEFKHLEYYYFHNCVYEAVWKDNRRRHAQRKSVYELLRTYPHDYKLIFVGDASMSPYEILQPGGSVEHWNDEAGATWLKRMTSTWEHCVWLNPEREDRWDFYPSVQITRELMDNKMFPLTLSGLDRAIKALH